MEIEASPNRHITWSFACPKCADEYEFYGYISGLHTIRKDDAHKQRTLVEQYREARRKTYETASKYEQQWVDYVLSRPSKAAIHRALAPGIAYSAVLRNAQRGEWLEREARSRFQLSPKECLDRLGIEDADVNKLDQDAEAREKQADEFWKSIEKTPVPFR